MPPEQYDIVIVGAGLSGIGAACRLQRECPGKRFCLLESRAAIGGTWDLFRYPGIRSDSDMHTLGYDFRPWRGAKAIADGPSILAYIREAAAAHDVERHVRHGCRVVRASWSSADDCWTIEAARVESGDPLLRIRCRMLLMCPGYYRYDRGHSPELPGTERFAGRIVHPQHWPEGLDCSGKQVVVIGSGATAVTLIPELARKAGHVVMLQRSPTWIIAFPDRDRIADVLRWLFPGKLAYALIRRKNIAIQQWLYRRTRTRPDQVRRFLLRRVRKALGPDHDIQTHFTPRYDPWDQRLCLAPNGDFFAAVRSGRASVMTDTIETFTERGVRLASGTELPADIVVTATGLELLVLGGVELKVDGEPVDVARRFSYKGIMLSEVPNLVTTFGYINASWTLRSDLIAAFFCRLVERMDRTGARRCTPRLRPDEQRMEGRPWIVGFSSGYIQRVLPELPRQGDREPWINPQHYATDRRLLLDEELDDGVLQFESAVGAS